MRNKYIELAILLGIIAFLAWMPWSVNPEPWLGSWHAQAHGETIELEFTPDGFLTASLKDEVKKASYTILPGDGPVYDLDLEWKDERVRTIIKIENDDTMLVWDNRNGKERPDESSGDPLKFRRK